MWKAREEFAVEADPEFADLLPGYLKKRRQDIGQLSAALERGDFKSIAKTSHKIHGSAPSTTSKSPSPRNFF